LRDLKYPNEYVRGSTLRFLCKLNDASVLPPLVEAVRENLQHPKAYVRRNAVLAIYSIYKEFPHLIPDASDGVFEAFTTVRYLVIFHTQPLF
jgi:coatomer subunit beta